MKLCILTIDRDGDRIYCNEAGQWHRDDGPTFEATDGYRAWYQKGLRHRDKGPAIIYPDDFKAWYQRDKLHRTDGPAILYNNGRASYWVEGIQVDPF